jgi:hypothetical protein
MQGLSVRILFLALAVLIAGSGVASAEMTHWSYSASTDPVEVPGSGGGGVGGPFYGLSFTPFVNISEVGSGNVVLVRMEPFDIRPFPDRGTNVPFNNAPFTLNVGLGDTASGRFGNLIFPGLVNGSSDTGIRLTFTVPTTQELVLGQNRYTLGLGTYVPPGPLDSGQLGSLSAQVNVSPPSSPSATPEPSCLVLAGMGLLSVAGAAWRKRRGKTSAALEAHPAA